MNINTEKSIIGNTIFTLKLIIWLTVSKFIMNLAIFFGRACKTFQESNLKYSKLEAGNWFPLHGFGNYFYELVVLRITIKYHKLPLEI